jgi:hypothetical protein
MECEEMPSRYLVHGLGKLKPKDTESWRQYTERSKVRSQLLTLLPQQQKCITQEFFFCVHPLTSTLPAPSVLLSNCFQSFYVTNPQKSLTAWSTNTSNVLNIAHCTTQYHNTTRLNPHSEVPGSRNLINGFIKSKGHIVMSKQYAFSKL